VKQSKNIKSKFILTLVLVFLFCGILIYVLSNFAHVFSPNVLQIGNAFLFVASLLSLVMGSRVADQDNPHRFVRGITGATFLKFGLCLIAGVVYIITQRHNVQWPDIIALMFLYMLYTTVETMGLMKTAKN